MVASGRTGRFGLLRVCCSQPVNQTLFLLSFFFFLLLRPVSFISFSSFATASRPPPPPPPPPPSSSSPLATVSTSFHDLLPVLVFAAFLTSGAYFNARGGDALCASTKVTATARLPAHRRGEYRVVVSSLSPPFSLIFLLLLFISARGYWGDNVVFRRFPRSSVLSASFAARYIAGVTERARGVSKRPADLCPCKYLCYVPTTLTEACPCRQPTIRMSKYIFVQSGCAT